MKLSDFNANAYIYGLDITESTQSIVEMYVQLKDKIEEEIEKGDDKRIKGIIKLFREKYAEQLVTLSALILVHNRLRNRDTNERLVTVMSSGIKTLVNGNKEQSLKALDVIKKELEDNKLFSKSGLGAMYSTEVNGRKAMMKSGLKGVEQGKYHNFIDTLNDMLAIPRKYAEAFDKYHKSHKVHDDGTITKDGEKVSSQEEIINTFESHEKESLRMPLQSTLKKIKESKDNILESMDIIADCGYLDNYDEIINEAEEKEKADNQYFMFVDLSVYTEDKPVEKHIPFKNYKVTIGTVAKDVEKARKNIEKQVNKSLKKLNKSLGKEVKVIPKTDEQYKTNRVYEGADTILDKNIKAQTNIDKISSGVWFLKGLNTSGNIGGIEHSTEPLATLSKSSITRMLNKSFKK